MKDRSFISPLSQRAWGIGDQNGTQCPSRENRLLALVEEGTNSAVFRLQKFPQCHRAFRIGWERFDNLLRQIPKRSADGLEPLRQVRVNEKLHHSVLHVVVFLRVKPA